MFRSLHGQSVIRGVRAMVDSINEKIYDKIFESVARGEMPDVNDLLDDADQVLLKRRILSLRRERYPPITTHDIPDDADDPVLNQLRDCGLVNAPDDPVKVIYHPQVRSHRRRRGCHHAACTCSFSHASDVFVLRVPASLRALMGV